MTRNILNSNSPLITSIVASSYAMGIPLDDDMRVQEEYAEAAADKYEADQMVEDEIYGENEDKRSIVNSIVLFFTKHIFQKFIGKTLGLFNVLDTFKSIAKSAYKVYESAYRYMTCTFQAVQMILSFIVTHTFKTILKLLFKNPLTIAISSLTVAGLALYNIANRKKIKEIKDRLDTYQPMYGQSYEILSPIQPVQLTQEEYDRLTDFRESNEDLFTPETEILHTMKTEGWDKIFYDGTEFSKFGITANERRSVEFVRNLTWKQAYDIYKKEYWDAAKVESVPEEMQRIYFNTAVNMGVGAAKELYRESDGTLEGFVNARNRRYRSIAIKKPSKAKYLQGWLRRSQQEYEESLDAIKNAEKFRRDQARENAELIKFGKTLGAV